MNEDLADDRYEAGMRVRREVLGDDHVERAIAATTDLDADFQRYITESAWGSIWTRDDKLDRRTRSCITIALLTALRLENELAMHVRAANRYGLTAEEITEVIMHTAPYTGIPCANAAFAIAKSALANKDDA